MREFKIVFKLLVKTLLNRGFVKSLDKKDRQELFHLVFSLLLQIFLPILIVIALIWLYIKFIYLGG